jgi:hypothetical protein
MSNIKEKSELFFEEFIAFRSEEEKEFLKWFFIIDLIFLLSSLIALFTSKEIFGFDLEIMSWTRFLSSLC